MRAGNPYSALGGVFEYLNKDCGYEQWSQYLISKLTACGVPQGAKGLDAGCGNGYFTRALVRAGYFVTGMDVSPEMLSCAVDAARKEGLSAQFVSGDIRKFRLNGKSDFIVAVNDCLNYVEGGELSKAFLSVGANLKKGGVFIFDISSEYKLKNLLADNTFADDGEDVSWLWFNTFKGDRVEMDISVFTKQADGSYRRADESQTQFVHREEDVVGRLKAAGFDVQVEGHLGKEKTERINFICRKL
jgi:SAM-dependent methyltransferase